MDSSLDSEHCYRHPDRPTGAKCQRCGKLICSQCRYQASVGFHCPECVSGSQQRVYTASNLPGSVANITQILIGVNAFLFILSIVLWDATLSTIGQAAVDVATWGTLIDLESEWWRIISGGFFHSGIIHIAFNMYLLWMLGQRLERSLGAVTFSAAYLVSLIGGSLGALLQSPNVPVVGASGAVFGLFGVTVFFLRSRGVGIFDTSLGMLIGFNLLLSFRPGVSFGGHVGGFITGLIIGAILYGVEPGKGPLFGKNRNLALAVIVIMGVVFFAGSLAAAGRWDSV